MPRNPPQKVVTQACVSAGNSALAAQWVAPWQPMLFFLVRVPVPLFGRTAGLSPLTTAQAGGGTISRPPLDIRETASLVSIASIWHVKALMWLPVLF